MNRLAKINEEIFVANDAIARIGPADIAFIKSQAAANQRKRARICAHKDNNDPLHEMMIAISAQSYIHPHKHLGKSESFHIVEGEVDVVVLSDDGAIAQVIELGEPGSGKDFYYRLDDARFHTLLIRSEFLVVHEVTNGPFSREKTVQAPWAPSEGEEGATKYMEQLRQLAAKRKENS